MAQFAIARVSEAPDAVDNGRATQASTKTIDNDRIIPKLTRHYTPAS